MSHALHGLLWEWLEDGDYLEGMLAAAEAAGLLDAEDVAGFRRMARTQEVPPARGDVTAAKAHLMALLSRLQPMRREPDPAAQAAAQRFHGALSALRAAGLLSDAEAHDWHADALAAEAPWLEDPHAIPSQGTVYAIAVPPETPEQAAEDAAWEEQYARMAKRGAVREVLVAQRPQRHGRLALTALVTRTESIDLHFHEAGTPVDPGDLDAFRTRVDALAAPALTDDAGTVYEAIMPHPVSSSGGQAISGYWRYLPAPPPEAREFRAGPWSFR